MSHDESMELLAPLALDAIDNDERAELENHVDTCPICQRELDQLREVTYALGNSVEPLPQGLWTNIANRLHPDEAAPLDHPDAIAPEERIGLALLPTLDHRWKRNRMATALVIGAMAAGLFALSLSLASADNRVNHFQNALNNANSQAVAAALVAPGHRTVELGNGGTPSLAEFVLLPNGNGYLVKSDLPILNASSTYQLWGIINGKPISLALMGRAPRFTAFTVVGPPVPSAIAITVEPAGGSPAPTTAIVASKTL
jgi:anti-sigma factor RsiW